MAAPRVVIAILAAGSGSRFGGDKLLAPLAGRTLLRHAIDAALASQAGPVIAVVGAVSGPLGAVIPRAVTLVANPECEEGIASSVRAAVMHVNGARDIDGLCIGLGDQPLVGSEAYRRLAAAHASGAELAVATYRGERRNPALLARAHWPEALTLTGDQGARRLMRAHAVIEVPCDDTGDPFDVDSAADLIEAGRRLGEARSHR